MAGALIAAAVIGGVINVAGYTYNQGKAEDYYKDKALEAKINKALALNELKLDFEENKKQAYKSADRSDAQSTLNEGLVSIDTNNSIDNLRLSQLMEGLQYNNAAQEIGQTTGNELSNIAASGIRAGDSLSQAVDLEASKNMQQLQLSEQVQRSKDNLELSNILNNLNKNVFGIQSDRTDAFDLRESFAENTGYQWKKFSNAYAKTEYAYDQMIKEYEDAADEASLGSFGSFLGGLQAFFGGAQAGATTVSSWQSYINDMKSPTYDTATKNNTAMSFNSIGTNQNRSYWT